MYRNWTPTMECPTITSQVVKDLREAYAASKEVMNRLAGRDDDSEKRVYQILEAYETYVTTQYKRVYLWRKETGLIHPKASLMDKLKGISSYGHWLRMMKEVSDGD